MDAILPLRAKKRRNGLGNPARSGPKTRQISDGNKLQDAEVPKTPIP